MKNKKAIIFRKVSNIFFRFASVFAVVISTIAINQRCWYIMYEEPLPNDIEKLKAK